MDLGSHKTTDNIALNKAFTVAMGDAAHVVQCDYLGLVSGRKEPDKLSMAGFTVRRSEFVNAPVINELPLTLECELIRADGGKYFGRIVNTVADESILNPEGKIDLSKFHPITYDTSTMGYYALGERVGQAFSDGKRLI